MEKAEKRLLEIITDIVEGRYSDDIIGLTGPDIFEPIRKIAEAMANALETRDANTRGHTARVGELARRIALEMDQSEEEEEFIRLAGLLHDIGKIGFPDSLVDDDWESF